MRDIYGVSFQGGNSDGGNFFGFMTPLEQTEAQLGRKLVPENAPNSRGNAANQRNNPRISAVSSSNSSGGRKTGGTSEVIDPNKLMTREEIRHELKKRVANVMRTTLYRQYLKFLYSRGTITRKLFKTASALH